MRSAASKRASSLPAATTSASNGATVRGHARPFSSEFASASSAITRLIPMP